MMSDVSIMHPANRRLLRETAAWNVKPSRPSEPAAEQDERLIRESYETVSA